MNSILNRVRNHSGAIIGILIAIGVLVAIAVTALTAVCGGSIPLPEGETCTQCVREWIGAFSGWAAAAGALITAGLLLSQISEMRSQNDFLMGRLPVELRPKRWRNDVNGFVFELVNRNIEPIHIERYYVADDDEVWIQFDDENLYGSGDTNTEGSSNKSWSYVRQNTLAGWTNKAEMPSKRIFTITITDDNSEFYFGFVTLHVDYRFVGSDEIRTVNCTVDLAFFQERA